MKKKIALLLTLVMCLSAIFSVNVFADDPEIEWSRTFNITDADCFLWNCYGPDIIAYDYGGNLCHHFDEPVDLNANSTITIIKDTDGYYELQIEYSYICNVNYYGLISECENELVQNKLVISTDSDKHTVLSSGVTPIIQYDIHSMPTLDQYSDLQISISNNDISQLINGILNVENFSFSLSIDQYENDNDNVFSQGFMYFSIHALEEITPTIDPLENGNYTGTGNAYVLTPFGRFNIATLPLTKATVANNSINLSFRANTLQYNVIADKVSYDSTTGTNTYSVVINDSTVNNGTWEFTITPDGLVTGKLTSPNGDTLNFTMELTKS